MSKLLALIQGLISVVAAVAGYLNDKRLMDAGAAEAALKGLRDADSAIARARAAANAPSVPESEDPDNRRNRP